MYPFINNDSGLHHKQICLANIAVLCHFDLYCSRCGGNFVFAVPRWGAILVFAVKRWGAILDNVVTR